MQIQTVGILSPGDMGQAMSDDKPLRVYASVLNRHGLKTIAALGERSDVYDGLRLRTRQLATAANVQDVGSIKQLVIESDIVLSVLGRETPEESDRDRPLPDIVTTLSQESLNSQ